MSTISTWLKNSGLKVNGSKTEVCIFSRTMVASMDISINGIKVRTKKEIGVLGIVFDSWLQWGPLVQRALTRANKALSAIKLIKNYFNPKELLQLITYNFYSVLDYNFITLTSKSYHLPSTFAGEPSYYSFNI